MKKEGSNYFNVEKRYVSKSNETVWVSLNATMIRDFSGEPSHMIGHVVDITSRKLETIALLESEERFRQLYEGSSTGIWMPGLDGVITSVNPALCITLGYTREEMVGKDVVDFMHADDREETLEAISTHDSRPEIAKQLLRKDGTAIWVTFSRSVIRDSNGELLYRFGQLHDLSEQYRIQLELQEQHKRQELISKISIAANQSQNIDSLLSICITSICQFTGWEIGHAAFYRGEKSVQLQSSGVWYLFDEARFSPLQEFTAAIDFESVKKLMIQILSEKKALWRQIGQSSVPGPRTNILKELGLNTSIKIPIIVGKNPVDVLGFFTTQK